MSNIEATFEQVFDYYRNDQSIQAMFKGLDLLIVVKFANTKQKYYVTIKQDQEIFQNLTPFVDKPDIKVRISSEQLLIDLVNGKLPISEQFVKGKIMITKGFVKIAKIYRKYVKEE